MHGNDINKQKYFWLKLDRHFFTNARIKKLRHLENGDTYTIIYLKLMLLSIECDGTLVFEGIEETIEKEMALKLEESDENVATTMKYLQSQGLMTTEGDDVFLREAANSIGQESRSNVYKREKGEKEARKSYDEIIEEMEEDGFGSLIIKPSLIKFIQHLQANKVVMINDRLRNIIVKLDLLYDTDIAEKTRCINRAIDGGYLTLDFEKTQNK